MSNMVTIFFLSFTLAGTRTVSVVDATLYFPVTAFDAVLTSLPTPARWVGRCAGPVFVFFIVMCSLFELVGVLHEPPVLHIFLHPAFFARPYCEATAASFAGSNAPIVGSDGAAQERFLSRRLSAGVWWHANSHVKLLTFNELRGLRRVILPLDRKASRSFGPNLLQRHLSFLAPPRGDGQLDPRGLPRFAARGAADGDSLVGDGQAEAIAPALMPGALSSLATETSSASAPPSVSSSVPKSGSVSVRASGRGTTAEKLSYDYELRPISGTCPLADGGVVNGYGCDGALWRRGGGGMVGR